MDGWIPDGQTSQRTKTLWNVSPWPAPAGPTGWLMTSSHMKKLGQALTGLELLQLPPEVTEAGLHPDGLGVHLVRALLQVLPLLLLLRAHVILAGARARQGLLHLPIGAGAHCPGQLGEGGSGGQRRWGTGERRGRGGGASLTSLISSCRCSSSEFCSLMKVNSAKLRSSTGERRERGVREPATEGHTGHGKRDIETDNRHKRAESKRDGDGEAEAQKARGTERKSEQVRVRERDGDEVKRDPEILRDTDTQKKREERARKQRR